MYNYDRFSTKFFDFSKFIGPTRGQSVSDFLLTTVDGRKVKLSDYKGRKIILETGSTTCPMYVKNINPMNSLANKFPEVKFVVLYVREAHPGGKIKGHRNYEEKLKCATDLVIAENEHREILIDDLEGKFHSELGLLPDMLYVLDEEGKVVFRSSWNEPKLVEDFLNKKLDAKEYDVDIREPSKPNPIQIIRTTARGGFLSFWDLILSLPKLILMHREVQKKLKNEKRLK